MTEVKEETNAAYHADLTHCSHSTLEVYRESPAKFHATYIAKTLPPQASTPAMALGSMVHCLVLEPTKFSQLYIVADGCENRRGSQWKHAAATAAESGRECVLPAQVDEAKRIYDAVLQHPVAERLLTSEGIAEKPIRWKADCGLALKCKPDWLVTDPSRDMVLNVDLKTSASPSPLEFAKQAHGFGYHRQAAHYNEGCAVEYDRACRSMYIVVGKAAPHDVFVYQPDDEFVELGSYENIVTRAALENSLNKNEWFSENQNELQTLSLPNWARRKSK